MNDPFYLGDGLYVSHDGFQYRLFTTREQGEVHEVFLEPMIMKSFFLYLEKVEGIKIKITKADENADS